MKLTNRIEENNVIVIPLGAEPFSNKELIEYRNAIDICKICYRQESVCPVGVSIKNSAYVIAVDLGKEAGMSFESLRRIYGQLVRDVASEYYQNITIVIPKIKGQDPVKTMESVAEGTQLGSYAFTKYKSKSTDKTKAPNHDMEVSLFIDEPEISQDYFDGLHRITVVTAGIKLTRDLVNEPGNKLTPCLFADRILEETRCSEISVDISDEVEMKKKNLAGILSVGKGSQRPSRLCILKYIPDPSFPTVALVGKGVTADLGGINLKIGHDLSLAKTDMGGAAVVVSVLKTIAALKIKANVYGIIPLVENICDGGALKPGEIIEYSNGTTVEIKNTDAEGRLILADGLLIARQFSPDAVIDIATLTGSCAQALGSQIAGILGTDVLVDQIIESGHNCGENLWKLPLFEEYLKELDSDVADISNIATEEPGVITAALFLKKFAGDANWAHIDIAGTRNAKCTKGHIVKGGSGFGVKTLVRFIEKTSDSYQKSI